MGMTIQMNRINVWFRRRLRLSFAMIAILGLLIGGSVVSTYAQVEPVESCILSPELLSGQGFSLSGQGFSLSGQGFSLSGQGFSLSGQGFSLSGQGFSLSGQIAVVEEIRDNPVTPGQWLVERLPFFDGAAGFNTVPTAILVVDDFGGFDFPTPIGRVADFRGFSLPTTHGGEVLLPVLDSIEAANAELASDLDIWIVPVDVSGAGVEYETDNLVSLLESITADLRANFGVLHFVYNFSFGLIACEDPGDPSAGIPPFDFQAIVAEVQEANEPQPPRSVVPILECVQDIGDNYFIAYFGYENENADTVTIPIGGNNSFFEPYGLDQGQPRLFEPGRQSNAFAVYYEGDDDYGEETYGETYVDEYESEGGTLTWSVTGPDGIEHSVTVDESAPACEPEPAEPTLPVSPVLECVEPNGEDGYIAHFGYNNPNPEGSLAVNIDVGVSNKFTPSPQDQGQPEIFLPGRHVDVFQVEFDSGNLVWTLDSKTATAGSDGSLCATDNGVGIDDLLAGQGVPADMVDERITELVDEVTNDPNLQPLQAYLREKLELSGDLSQPERHVGIASSGNLRLWLGGTPLAPALWPETIAVGATLNDTDSMWSFSQDGNVLAPGAGYPLFDVLGANTFGAGTSFSAPIFSTLVATCATLPYGLSFDGVNPPINPTGLNNSVIGTDDFAPLLCSINQPPVANDDAYSMDEDTTLTIAAPGVIDNDIDLDGNPLAASLVNDVANGTLTLNSDGSFSYTPNADFFGSDSFTYTVFDGTVSRNEATVTIAIADVAEIVPKALVEITAGGNLNASTFTNGSIQISNLSENAQITSVSIDLSTAIIPDMVYDPTGSGGASNSKCFTPNAGATATGFTIPDDLCIDPFSQPRNGGFDIATANFTDFDPGELFTFSVDLDPNSIQGLSGVGDESIVSGSELIGATITVTFSDGTVLVSSLYEDGSLGGSQAIVAENATTAPTVAALGVSSPAIVSDLNQTILVTGTPGAYFSLLQVDTRLSIGSGDDPFGVTPEELPFYANEALSDKEIYNGMIDGDGTVEVPVTLLITENGLNYFIAVTSSTPYVVDQQTSQTSNVVILKYEEETQTTLTGSFTLQGRTAYAVDLEVMLYPVGSTTPVYSSTVPALANGTFMIANLTPGTYQVAVKHAQSLQVVEVITISQGANSYDFGELRMGDINGDNQVTSLDFSALATSFNKQSGDAGFNPNADLNGDGSVTSLDFSLLASNFNISGESPQN